MTGVLANPPFAMPDRDRSQTITEREQQTENITGDDLHFQNQTFTYIS